MERASDKERVVERGRRSARLEGIQQFYSSRRLEVATRRIEDALRLE